VLKFNLKHLRPFLLLADCLHLGQAAALCCKTPAAVQHAIQALEQALHTKLLVRLATGWQLTPEGLVLQQATRAAMQHMEQVPFMLQSTDECADPKDAASADGTFRELSSRAAIFQLGISNSLAAIVLGLHACASLSALAKQLGLTQPAVSSALNGLEASLNVPIIRLDRQGVTMTQVGHVLRAHLTLALHVLETAQSEILAGQEMIQGTVRLGVTAYFKTQKFARCLHATMQAFPGVALQTHEQGVAGLLQALRSGDLDLVFTAVRHDFDDPVLHVQPWCQDSLSVIASASHPLAQASEIKLEQLLEHALLLPPPGAPSRAILDEYFCAQGLTPPQARLASGDIRTLETLLDTGAYVAVASRSIFEDQIAAGTLVAIPARLPQTHRSICMITRKTAFNSYTVQRVSAFFGQQGRSLLGIPGEQQHEMDLVPAGYE
jgi:LysR family transcriptional regulator of gallate degradation